jgi:hypothetical protein
MSREDSSFYRFITINGKRIKGGLVFNIFVEISSLPCEYFNLKDLIILSISLVDVFSCFILAKEF